jgi:hypothetical protein
MEKVDSRVEGGSSDEENDSNNPQTHEHYPNSQTKRCKITIKIF